MAEPRFTKILAELVDWDLSWHTKEWIGKPLSWFKTSLLIWFVDVCEYEIGMQEANEDFYDAEQKRYKAYAKRNLKSVKEELAKRGNPVFNILGCRREKENKSGG